MTRTRGQRFRKPLLYPSELQGQNVQWQVLTSPQMVLHFMFIRGLTPPKIPIKRDAYPTFHANAGVAETSPANAHSGSFVARLFCGPLRLNCQRLPRACVVSRPTTPDRRVSHLTFFERDAIRSGNNP